MDNLFLLIAIAALGFGVYYLIKRKWKKLGISMLVVLVGFIAFGVTAPPVEKSQPADEPQEEVSSNQSQESAEPEKENATDTKESTEPEESNEELDNVESVEDNTTEIKESTEQEEPNDELDSINEQLAKHLEDNKGWALGTIDEDGNKIDNGEPNPDYTIWLYVNSITYTGTDVELQVTADFKNLTNDEKEYLASSAQGATLSYAMLDSRPSVYVYNGEDAYGNSKILDPNNYSWN